MVKKKEIIQDEIGKQKSCNPSYNTRINIIKAFTLSNVNDVHHCSHHVSYPQQMCGEKNNKTGHFIWDTTRDVTKHELLFKRREN